MLIFSYYFDADAAMVISPLRHAAAMPPFIFIIRHYFRLFTHYDSATLLIFIYIIYAAIIIIILLRYYYYCYAITP